MKNHHNNSAHRQSSSAGSRTHQSAATPMRPHRMASTAAAEATSQSSTSSLGDAAILVPDSSPIAKPHMDANSSIERITVVPATPRALTDRNVYSGTNLAAATLSSSAIAQNDSLKTYGRSLPQTSSFPANSRTPFPCMPDNSHFGTVNSSSSNARSISSSISNAIRSASVAAAFKKKGSASKSPLAVSTGLSQSLSSFVYVCPPKRAHSSESLQQSLVVRSQSTASSPSATSTTSISSPTDINSSAYSICVENAAVQQARKAAILAQQFPEEPPEVLLEALEQTNNNLVAAAGRIASSIKSSRGIVNYHDNTPLDKHRRSNGTNSAYGKNSRIITTDASPVSSGLGRLIQHGLQDHRQIGSSGYTGNNLSKYGGYHNIGSRSSVSVHPSDDDSGVKRRRLIRKKDLIMTESGRRTELIQLDDDSTNNVVDDDDDDDIVGTSGRNLFAYVTVPTPRNRVWSSPPESKSTQQSPAIRYPMHAANTQQQQRIRRTINVSDDEDDATTQQHIDLSDDDDVAVNMDEDAYALEDDPTPSPTMSKILALFNDAPEAELVDTLQCSTDAARLIISLRPFTSMRHLHDMCEHGNKAKRHILKLVDRYEALLEGYKEVDAVIERCEAVGDEIKAVMQKWIDEAKAAVVVEAGSGDIEMTKGSGDVKNAEHDDVPPSMIDESRGETVLTQIAGRREDENDDDHVSQEDSFDSDNEHVDDDADDLTALTTNEPGLINGHETEKDDKVNKTQPGLDDYDEMMFLSDEGYHRDDDEDDDFVLNPNAKDQRCQDKFDEPPMVSPLGPSVIDLDADDEISAALSDEPFKCLMRQPRLISRSLRLKDYQLVGVSWLVLLFEKRLGGILADEMGLGKTAQVIAFIATLRERGHVTGIGASRKTKEEKAQPATKTVDRGYGIHLIVVPSSTLGNWLREFERWCPKLKVRAYHGSVQDRRDMQYYISDGARLDVLVTTYHLATGTQEDRAFLRRLPVRTLILDEGHMVKNVGSVRHRHLMAIRSKFRLLLTGTPLQNNLLELLALLTFVMPSLFAGATSLERIFDAKMMGATGGVTSTNKPNAGASSKPTTSSQAISKHETEQSRERIRRAKSIMAPFVLRRRKDQVLQDLPKKMYEMHMCKPTDTQSKLYHSRIVATKRKCGNTFDVKKRNVSNDGAGGNSKDGAIELVDMDTSEMSSVAHNTQQTSSSQTTLSQTDCQEDTATQVTCDDDLVVLDTRDGALGEKTEDGDDDDSPSQQRRSRRISATKTKIEAVTLKDDAAAASTSRSQSVDPPKRRSERPRKTDKPALAPKPVKEKVDKDEDVERDSQGRPIASIFLRARARSKSKEDDEKSKEDNKKNKEDDEKKPQTVRRRGRPPKKKPVEETKAAVPRVSNVLNVPDEDEEEEAKMIGAIPGKRQLTNILMELRKIACHPMLVRWRYTSKLLREMSTAIIKEPQYCDSNPQYVWEDMMVMSDFELDQLCSRHPKTMSEYRLMPETIMDACKVQKLAEMLPAMRDRGDRVLLFSHFVIVLDILEVVMERLGMKYVRLDGGTPVAERQEMIDQYNNDETITVFLLSTKAGGFGINLTSANTVILYDMHFNPHTDAQAEDRAHRVGQTRDVTVHRLLMEKSVEEHIFRLAQSKLTLDAKMRQDGQNGSADPSGDSRRKSGRKDGDEEDDVDSNSDARDESEMMEVLRNALLESGSESGADQDASACNSKA